MSETENIEEVDVWEHQDLASVKIKVFRGHKNKVSSVELCHNDRHVFSGSFDHTCRLWDTVTGRVITTFTGHHSFISEARMCKDERFFVSSGWDRNMMVWDVETQKILWKANHGGIVTSARFNETATTLVSANDIDFHVSLWDMRSNKRITFYRDLHRSTPTKCFFTPQDDRIFTTSMDRTAKVFDLRSNKVTLQFTNHKNIVSSAAISGDERKAATASWDKSVHIYDISTGLYRQSGPVILTGEHEGCVSCVNFSEDGSLLISGGYDNSVVVWDMETMTRELKLQGHEDWIEDVCFSKDQQWILSASKDGTIRMWNIENAESLPVVMESKISAGVKVMKCTTCGKPFSFSEVDGGRGQRCVFCRTGDTEGQLKHLTEISQKVSAITADLEL